MPYPDSLRHELTALLRGGQAHASTKQILDDISFEYVNKKPAGFSHSLWELVDHLRFTQSDILEFIVDPNYETKEWPKAYWPHPDVPVTEKDWTSSLSTFWKDLAAFEELVSAEDADFFMPIPHCGAAKYTLFRQVLVVADHNAHHLGQIILLRRALGIW
ncbi:MAG: DinB family protein [Calditrichia bacterium]